MHCSYLTYSNLSQLLQSRFFSSPPSCATDETRLRPKWPHFGTPNRVAQRSHVPGDPLVGPGFQLDLGLKDVTLALDAAHKVQAPMPFASVLHDRFLAAQAKGRGKLDWSAVALSTSEDAGVDISSASDPKAKQ